MGKIRQRMHATWHETGTANNTRNKLWCKFVWNNKHQRKPTVLKRHKRMVWRAQAKAFLLSSISSIKYVSYAYEKWGTFRAQQSGADQTKTMLHTFSTYRSRQNQLAMSAASLVFKTAFTGWPSHSPVQPHAYSATEELKVFRVEMRWCCITSERVRTNQTASDCRGDLRTCVFVITAQKTYVAISPEIRRRIYIHISAALTHHALDTLQCPHVLVAGTYASSTCVMPACMSSHAFYKCVHMLRVCVCSRFVSSHSTMVGQLVQWAVGTWDATWKR